MNIQTYKLNTNGTMSLDDTAEENKDISKKLREEILIVKNLRISSCVLKIPKP